MASILIIDRELGFMWALAYRLQTFGIAVIPSSSAEEAQTVLEALCPQLDLAIINCGCLGACAFTEQLRRNYPSMRMIGIISSGFPCSRCAPSFDATLHDPEDRHPGRLARCVELVRALVGQSRAQ
jgi:hypothetical protein